MPPPVHIRIMLKLLDPSAVFPTGHVALAPLGLHFAPRDQTEAMQPISVIVFVWPSAAVFFRLCPAPRDKFSDFEFGTCKMRLLWALFAPAKGAQVGEMTIKYSNLPERYIRRAMRQVEFENPKGKPQYMQKTLERRVFK